MLQDNLRFTLTIIGIFVIAAILLHGLWTIRKSKKNNKKGRASFESHNWEPDFEHEDDLEAEGPIFDDVGVSKARVIVNPQSTAKANTPQDSINSQNSFTGTDTPTTDETNPSEANLNEDLKATNVGIGRAFYEDNDIAKEQISAFVSPDKPSHEQSQASDSVETSDSSESSAEQSNKASSTETPVNDGHVTIDPKPLSAEGSESSSEALATRANEIDTSPVYSNVVTQPKPEFTRTSPKKETLETDFGQPPKFLLKKNQDAETETGQGSSAERAESSASPSVDDTQNVTQAAELSELDAKQVDSSGKHQSEDKGLDFSLNIQEGPSLPKQQAEQKQAKNEADKQKPGVEKELSFAEKAKRLVRRSKKTVADNIRKEPVLKNAPSEDQMRIDFESSTTTDAADELERSESTASAEQQKSAQSNANEQAQNSTQNSAHNDVLVLNVRANNDKPIEGAALLPMLLTLGFKFGEHDIFHRHVHSNGKGPILFSLTNMFKPGVFDIDNLENFNTLGISLFMMLPIDADAQQVFNMMHNAARKLADEFDCRILDGNKVGLSKQSLQQYSERIREFERKRSI